METYHIDDIKLMLQHEGTAYYNDANTIHGLHRTHNFNETKGSNKSIVGKLGNLMSTPGAPNIEDETPDLEHE